MVVQAGKQMLDDGSRRKRTGCGEQGSISQRLGDGPVEMLC
jgi:hypothetical protein